MDIAKVKSIGVELREAFKTTCQSRSDYQIERFVVGDHETPQRRYLQCLVEMQRKVSEISLSEVNAEELEDKIALAKERIAVASNDYERREQEREIRKAEINKWQLDLYVEGLLREFNKLYALFKQLPAYTADELRDAEEQYWQIRKAKQAQQQLDSSNAVAPDMLNVLSLVGLVPDDFSDRFNKILIAAKEKQDALPL